MSQLRRRALARLALSETEVQRLYDRSFPDQGGDYLLRQLRTLCESHERLRAELRGAEILLDDWRREVGGIVADLTAHPGCCDVWVRCLDRLRQLVPAAPEATESEGKQ